MIQSYHIDHNLSRGGGQIDNQSQNRTDPVTFNHSQSRRCAMLTVARQAELLDYLKEKKSATVAALSKSCLPARRPCGGTWRRWRHRATSSGCTAGRSSAGRRSGNPLRRARGRAGACKIPHGGACVRLPPQRGCGLSGRLLLRRAYGRAARPHRGRSGGDQRRSHGTFSGRARGSASSVPAGR